MIEPIPTTALDEFFGISLLFFAYVGTAVVLSAGVLYSITLIDTDLAIPPVLVFLTVAALLFAPVWSLFKAYYPDHQ